MEFLVFQRADSALIVVPALFQPPMACQRHGPVHLVGRCDLELEDFSPAVAAALAEEGFARVDGPDWAVLQSRLQRLRAPRDPEPALRVGPAATNDSEAVGST